MQKNDGRDMRSFLPTALAEIRTQVGDKQVLLGLSGGVDSSVVCALLYRAVGEQLTAVFVDHGLLRKNERAEVEAAFRPQLKDKLVVVDASERFLSRLKGVSDPEQKRKIIGAEFIEVFSETARNLSKLDFLAQGTIYTDVTESGKDGHAAIKAHHNVGGLPESMPFCGLVEPLRSLYKNEVRELGVLLGLPEALTKRQPFPGPGLGVRVLGEVTEAKLVVLREADAIFREEMDKAGVVSNEYFAIHPGLQSVGVIDGARVFGHTIALRAINSGDLVSASWTRIPYEVLERVSARITTECGGVNRVVYDITAKPPATIEWE